MAKIKSKTGTLYNVQTLSDYLLGLLGVDSLPQNQLIEFGRKNFHKLVDSARSLFLLKYGQHPNPNTRRIRYDNDTAFLNMPVYTLP